MPGEIKRMLDSIVRQRSKGDRILMDVTTTKLLLKGVDPDRFDARSADDPALIAKVRAIGAELGVKL